MENIKNYKKDFCFQLATVYIAHSKSWFIKSITERLVLRIQVLISLPFSDSDYCFKTVMFCFKSVLKISYSVLNSRL